jgi:hypothetical protein
VLAGGTVGTISFAPGTLSSDQYGLHSGKKPSLLVKDSNKQNFIANLPVVIIYPPPLPIQLNYKILKR